MKSQNWLLLGIVLVFVGGLMAWYFHTDGGKVEVKEVRFVGTNGLVMSGLLYVPQGVSAENPAPAILAIHGYINSRETQAPYAIEFSRRGYVVLALDQTGHGYSEAPAFANGFGGPDGLAYLRSLDIVDTENIGLEGHSMGGWASLIAAGVFPDDYKSINVQGSSTGTFGAPDGTAVFPRNFALTFSVWDEFSALMWGADTGAAIVDTEKLQTAFNTDAPVVEGQLYGNVEDGTARRLYQPVTTHPGDHLNSAAIASAVEWMQLTLEGGSELDPNNQVWMWNEIGRLIALKGMLMAMLGFGGVLLQTPFFTSINGPLPEAKPMRGTMVWVAYLLTAAIPVLTFFWLQNQGKAMLMGAENPLLGFSAPTPIFAQDITNGVVIWALGNALITLILFLIWHFSSNKDAKAANYGLSLNGSVILKSFVLAIAVIVFGYVLLAAADLIFKIDFRFWVVAIKLMSSLQFRIFLGYLPMFFLFFLMLGVALHGQLRLMDNGNDVPMWRAMLANVGLLVLGIIILLLIQYLPLMAGSPLPLGEPLLTIVAYQFVGLLTIVGIFSTFFFRRTGNVWAGAFICAMLITWIIVAGQATHYPF
jgi:pimeloyl-ACP methyl ester carboxylesterase